MIVRMIIWLLGKKLGVKKYETFVFTNQKSLCCYYLSDDGIYRRNLDGVTRESNVRLNWLLSPECEVKKC